MEPIIYLNPILQAALLHFHLVTGGPPMVLAQASLSMAIVAKGRPGPIGDAAGAAAMHAPLPVAPAAPPPATAPAGQKLAGLAAWKTLVGNSVTGKSDDDDLVEYYAKNGTVKQRIGDDTSTGKWTMKGQKICFDYGNDEDETCYRVKVLGTTAIFTDDDGNDLVYAIVPGNAKKL